MISYQTYKGFIKQGMSLALNRYHRASIVVQFYCDWALIPALKQFSYICESENLRSTLIRLKVEFQLEKGKIVKSNET